MNLKFVLIWDWRI